MESAAADNAGCSGNGSLRRPERIAPRRPALSRLSAAWLIVSVITTGCVSLFRPLPAVNLQEPGWTLHQGQAVWKMPGGKHDMAGEVLVALGPNGQSFVQFTKSPFPLIIGRTLGNRWQVEFPAQNKRYTGFGSPPRRLIWLYLPQVLEGKSPPPHWTWKYSQGNWRLDNTATAETLEGFFVQ